MKHKLKYDKDENSITWLNCTSMFVHRSPLLTIPHLCVRIFSVLNSVVILNLLKITKQFKLNIIWLFENTQLTNCCYLVFDPQHNNKYLYATQNFIEHYMKFIHNFISVSYLLYKIELGHGLKLNYHKTWYLITSLRSSTFCQFHMKYCVFFFS